MLTADFYYFSFPSLAHTNIIDVIYIFTIFFHLETKQGRIHGHRCVRLCYPVNSSGAFVRVGVYVHVYVRCVCVSVCVHVCVAIPRLCGAANLSISAARLCVCVCVCACVSLSVVIAARLR